MVIHPDQPAGRTGVLSPEIHLLRLREGAWEFKDSRSWRFTVKLHQAFPDNGSPVQHYCCIWNVFKKPILVSVSQTFSLGGREGQLDWKMWMEADLLENSPPLAWETSPWTTSLVLNIPPDPQCLQLLLQSGAIISITIASGKSCLTVAQPTF